MTATKSPKLGKTKMTALKWAVNIILPLIVLFIPTTEAFTMTIKMFLVITLFAIILIATENLPMAAIALALPAVYIVFLQVPSAVALAPWTTDIPWIILCGFLVTVAMEKTGFLKRVAYACILAMGGKFRGIIYGMLIAGTLFSLIITDVSAKAVLLGALGFGICKAMELEPGGRASSAIGLATLLAVLNPCFFVLHGTNANLIPFSILEGMGIATPTWGEFFIHMFVPSLVYTILCALAIDLFFKPGQELHTKEFFKKEKLALGKMNGGELKFVIIALLMIVTIVGSSMLKLPVSVGMIFLFATSIMLLPGVKLIEPGDFKKINFPFILFVAACLSIGIVSANLGVGQFIADIVHPWIAGGSELGAFGGVWGFGFLANFLLTPLAAYSAFTEPVAMIAQSMGLNPVPVIYTFVQSLEQVIFPYEYAPILMVYSFGMISFKNMVKYCAIRAVLSIITIFIVFIPWWNLIGLM